MIQPLRKHASLADGAISYLEWATTGPKLNFAHANGFNAETYRSILAPLTDRFHIFACDQRGHGASTLPTTSGLAKDWTVFRDDLLDYLNVISPEPIILAGHSMGATASLMAAAASPDRVQALVLFEPVLVAPDARSHAHRRANPGPDLATLAARRRDTFPSFDAALNAYRGRGIFKNWPDALIADYLHGGLKPAIDGTLQLACPRVWEAESFRETPFGASRFARDVRCPITIVVGTIRSTSFDSEIEAIVATRPETRVVKVDGASHFLPMERPALVRAEIELVCEHL
jgi:pimeloyl-ACP methyl ester carboxylesterase